jgi:GntR family transcriptional repressor for pyruvate dehydrogenase complex
MRRSAGRLARRSSEKRHSACATGGRVGGEGDALKKEEFASGSLKKDFIDRPVYLKIVAAVQEAIRRGELAPGDRLLPERHLAERLNVSRSSVREAIAVLAGMGIVEVSPRNGVYVRRKDWKEVIKTLAHALMQERLNISYLLEVRRILESQGARLAARRADAFDIARLRELAANVVEDVREGRSADDSDTAFHLAIIESAKNPLLVRVIEVLVPVMRETYGPLRRRMLADPAVGPSFLADHEELISAVEAGDEIRAMKVIETHVDRAVRYLARS